MKVSKYKNSKNKTRKLYEALLVGPTGSYASQRLEESEARLVTVEDVFDMETLNSAFYGVVDFLRECTNDLLSRGEEISLEDIFNFALQEFPVRFADNPFEGLGDFVLSRLMSLVTDLDSLEQLLENF